MPELIGIIIFFVIIACATVILLSSDNDKEKKLNFIEIKTNQGRLYIRKDYIKKIDMFSLGKNGKQIFFIRYHNNESSIANCFEEFESIDKMHDRLDYLLKIL